MFRGRYVHTIDAKGRVSLPAEFRTELQRRSERPPILTNMLECLALYPAEDWEAYEDKLLGVDPFKLEGHEMQRFMISGATVCAPDSQGRILIPPYLREHAGLDKEVTIAGVGARIELWDRARFDHELARTQARFREISAEVSKNAV
ncbi:MAG: division/cell wall cluster transcriptional repressor MraZ [Proteobacteria bacterium]|nr:MAG: division/cell wall cluster transcriptional repressor MraZ [Pseudomonadota bacterium]